MSAKTLTMPASASLVAAVSISHSDADNRPTPLQCAVIESRRPAQTFSAAQLASALKRTPSH